MNMSEKKAILVSLVVMALLGGMILCFRIFTPPIYYILMQIISFLGLAAFGYWFFCWLQTDGQTAQDADYTSMEPTSRGQKDLFDQDHYAELFNSASSVDYSECQNTIQ